MAERVVKIKLIAEATGMVQGFNRAKDAVAETKTKVEESARSSREEWSKVGQGLTAVGIAITGVGVAALKTGIQYNTLQQTSRAALTSLLGSAQAANAQMDKLDDFARNSPFSKATFITAQQQMLAFGIEAKKVIPYLDGIQNAVAAAGGSNADIEGIVATMSKIQSSSKITATDLMEFGNRGVNAAELIGSQMGKTGAQIREDITAGSLSAEDALDALAKGMTETYNGAADNVKNTFAGSLDRVKAAWRDFSAELAKPLVDPNGGGALVDLLNWTADAMRNFEKLPEPVKATVSALTGLVGVGSLVAGTAILALPKWIAFKGALATFSPAAAGARGGLMNIVRFLGGPWGIAMLAAAATIGVLNAQIQEGRVKQTELSNSLKTSADSAIALRKAAETGSFETFWMGDAYTKLQDLPGLMDTAREHGTGFFSFLENQEYASFGALNRLGEGFAELASVDFSAAQKQFQDLAQSQNLNEEQTRTLLEVMPAFHDAVLSQATEMGIAADSADFLKLAMGEIGPAAEGSTKSLEAIQGAAEDTSEAISDLASEIMNFGSAQISADEAAIKFQEQLAALNERIAEGEVGLSANTEAGRENIQSLLSLAKATSESAAKTLEATGSQSAANDVLQVGRDKLVAAAQAYGMTAAEAEAYINQILATPQTVATAVQLNGIQQATYDLDTYLGRLASVPSVVSTEVRQFQALVYRDPASLYAGEAYGGTVGYAAGGTIGGIGGYVSGGTVFGRGGTKSDSVLVRLSRGEEVIQEPYASMYRRELKQMNRGDFAPSSMTQQPIIVIPQAPAAPVIGGNLQFVSSGNLHSDVGTVMHELRKRQRGGKYVGSR